MLLSLSSLLSPLPLYLFTVAPQWSSWGAWSGCSATCGTGRRTRVRRCTGGNNCIGVTQEYEDCKLSTCPGSRQ